jgi:hypothetical protein
MQVWQSVGESELLRLIADVAPVDNYIAAQASERVLVGQNASTRDG